MSSIYELNRIGTPRSNPIHSIGIAQKDQASGLVYVEPIIFSGCRTFQMERGRLKVYPDGSGNKQIPPEWPHDGVTVEYNRTGGGEKGVATYIAYTFHTGCVIGQV